MRTVLAQEQDPQRHLAMELFQPQVQTSSNSFSYMSLSKPKVYLDSCKQMFTEKKKTKLYANVDQARKEAGGRQLSLVEQAGCYHVPPII